MTNQTPSSMMNYRKTNGGTTMNLKEAFRFQNKVQKLMDEGQSILSREKNVTKVETTYFRKKVMQEAEDETVVEVPETEYADHITEMVGFMMYLLEQREKLSKAIRKAKSDLDIDMDSEVSLNIKRQELSRLISRMCDIRGSEVVIPNGGTGYRFNAEGNQVSYRCDVKKVTTINYDRNKVRSHVAALNRKSDAISVELDRSMVNSVVDYDAPFDVNDSFADVFESFLDACKQ